MGLDVIGYQRRLKEAPVVYLVVYRDGEVSQVYETREAAQLEVDFARRAFKERLSIRPIHVHSAALAKERWASASDMSDVTGEEKP